MGGRLSILEELFAYARSLGAESMQVEHKDGKEWIFARKSDTGIGFASYPSTSAQARALRAALYAAAKKPLNTVMDGQPCRLRVRISESFGEDCFEVTASAPRRLPGGSGAAFTALQGRYLAFIHLYTRLHRRPPSESDMQEYFRVTPPSVHQMVLTLESKGLIERTPGQARSIRVLVPGEQLPDLE